jgi:hypothetical protein
MQILCNLLSLKSGAISVSEREAIGITTDIPRTLVANWASSIIGATLM